MTRIRWRILALGLALLAAAVPAAALTIREQKTLSFGLIAAGPASGAVQVAPNGAPSCGPHTCLGGQRAARFRLSGGSHQVYDISFSSGDTLQHSGGGGSIPLQNLADGQGGTVVLNGGGQGRVDVGGDLVVGPTTAGGDYAGTYTIFFNLQ